MSRDQQVLDRALHDVRDVFFGARVRIGIGRRRLPRLAFDVERPELVAVEVALAIIGLEQPHDVLRRGHAFVEGDLQGLARVFG